MTRQQIRKPHLSKHGALILCSENTALSTDTVQMNLLWFIFVFRVDCLLQVWSFHTAPTLSRTRWMTERQSDGLNFRQLHSWRMAKLLLLYSPVNIWMKVYQVPCTLCCWLDSTLIFPANTASVTLNWYVCFQTTLFSLSISNQPLWTTSSVSLVLVPGPG